MKFTSILAVLCLLVGMAGAGDVYPDPIMDSDQPDARKNGAKLPVLDKGEGKGYFCYFDGRTYAARVDDQGGLELRTKDRKGEFVGDWWTALGPMRLMWTKSIGEKNGRLQRKHFWRYLKDVGDAEAEDQPRRKVDVEATMMDDVKYVRTFEFDRDSIIVGLGIGKDVANPHASYHNVALLFPRVMTFDNDKPLEERKKALKGYELEVKQDRKRSKYEYWDNPDLGVVSEFSAKGPWGDKEIKVSSRDQEMYLNKYKGTSIYEGFNARYMLPKDSTSYSKRLHIKIEIK